MSAGRIREVLEEAIRVLRDLAAQAEEIARAARIVSASLKAGGTLYLCGT
ncbi:MAG: SIS domain-containing protein, partial [Planctomycetes bacterium]|nr:SIS domain-containing protein [Planctomycetota bacterium]